VVVTSCLLVHEAPRTGQPATGPSHTQTVPARKYPTLHHDHNLDEAKLQSARPRYSVNSYTLNYARDPFTTLKFTANGNNADVDGWPFSYLAYI
jgi:hypothetical protein